MKVFIPALIAVAAADEKKVPPRHPLQRLKKLTTFSAEWCDANLSDKQAANWSAKFERNASRMERRFEICGFYDENQLPHGGPEPSKAKRSAEDEDEEFLRYDKLNPVRGIQQITRGFSKWAERYISTCKVQPAKQVDRMSKWNAKMNDYLLANASDEKFGPQEP